MASFTPFSALAGGLLIGSAAIVLLWLNGRIAGVTGMITGLLVKPSTAPGWRMLFLVGLVVGTVAYGWLGQSTPLRQAFPTPVLIVAGLLTGYGTAQANGCTSGHGVCGMARLSVRSLVATGTFLVVAIVTTYVLRHVAGVTA